MLDPTPGNGQLEEERAKNGEICLANDNFGAKKYFCNIVDVDDKSLVEACDE